MNDKEFFELELRATIVPQQVRWPAPEYLHWQRLHEAANEARERVSRAHTQMDEIDCNPELSHEGKGISATRSRPRLSRSLRRRERWRVRVRP